VNDVARIEKNTPTANTASRKTVQILAIPASLVNRYPARDCPLIRAPRAVPQLYSVATLDDARMATKRAEP
jgi:hypothetical protein